MRYEILLLATPEITASEITSLEAQLRDAIQQKQGNCLSFEKWGKFRLSYPVNHHEYGVYFLIRFESVASKVQELLAALRGLVSLKYNEIIMRSMVTRLDPDASLEYQRPESLEEIPGKSADSLLREHKLDFGGDMRSDMRMGKSQDEEL